MVRKAAILILFAAAVAAPCGPALAKAASATMAVSVTVAEGCQATANAQQSTNGAGGVSIACPQGTGWTAVTAVDGKLSAGSTSGGTGTGTAQAIAVAPGGSAMPASGTGDLVVTISY